MQKKHSFQARLRAFLIWQKLGYLPWRKVTKAVQTKESGEFYKGAFDSIPFLNHDAKRTFTHLLLRPGYMIRDYIRGQHDRYLAPFTSLLIFYAFFGLVSSVLQPVQHDQKEPLEDVAEKMEIGEELRQEEDRAATILTNTVYLLRQGYIYLHLDQHPEEVDTQHEQALAALESRLRGQGIPLFLGQFLLLWMAMTLVLRKYRMGLSACATISAYVLCQFSFFMMFVVLMTWGKSTSISTLLMLAVLIIDYYQLLDLTPWKSFKLSIRTGIMYALVFTLFILLLSLTVLAVAYYRS